MTLDELIRAATEKAASMGMRIELVAHGPEESQDPEIFLPEHAELAQKHIGRICRFRLVDGEWSEAKTLAYAEPGYTFPFGTHEGEWYPAFKLDTPTTETEDKPTDRLTAIEARLAALESAAQPTPTAQTRTYPEVEWSECRDGLSYGKVNGAVIGIACEDGDHRFLGGHWKHNQGSIDTAKIGVVSELRRWWDDLHTTPTPNQ